MRPSSLILASLLLCTSCANLHTGRTYLSEMEHEDGRFFAPEQDFPVVVGDTGEMGFSEEDRRARTPASTQDMASQNFQRTMKHELRELERSQSEESEKLYEAHKHQLATVSERIYFLKLPPHERRDYLEGRGFIEQPKAGPTQEQIHFGIRRNEVMLGMRKPDVLGSLGKPYRVEIAGNPSYENERWAYRVNGQTKYIYFESGEVQGWE